MSRILGIDYGEKRVGVAVSDEAAEFAFPLEVLVNDKNIFEKLKKICQEKEIKEIVLGLPLDFQGRPTHATEGAERPFQKKRFDSQRVRKQKTLPKIDASAAALILKTYLQRKKDIQ